MSETATAPADAAKAIDISRMSHGELFVHVWNNEIRPAFNEKAKRDAERRVDAFAETTVTLCGEEVRMMTPRDLFVLDACENPLVSGGIPDEADCARFVWTLHASNNGRDTFANRFRKGRIIQRIMSRPDLAETVAEIEEYVDRMLLDQTDESEKQKTPEEIEQAKAERKQPNTHFISPLLINVASDIGHCDPMTGKLLGDTPLPRLIQYARDIQKSKGNADADGDRLTERLQRKCMERVNAIIAERAKTAQTS
jgi:hypothetical protein